MGLAWQYGDCDLLLGRQSVNFSRMSTLVEIQDAVSHLSTRERRALQLWLNSMVEPDMNAQEEARLLQSLDDAVCDVDAGKGIEIDEVRKRIGSWAAK